MPIGDKIRKLREEKGLSQTDLAKMVDTTRQAIYKYEKGVVSNMPINKLKEIAYALGCEPAYLIGWDEPEEEPPPLTDKQKELYTKLCTLSDEECEAWIKLLGGK